MATRPNYSMQRSISENSQNENREAEQKALISEETDMLKPEDRQPACPCASSCHVHQKTAYNQTTETCRLDPEREENSNTTDSNSSHRSSTSEQRQSAQQECSIDMTNTGSEFSLDSSGKKKSKKSCQKLRKRCCQLATILVCSAIMSCVFIFVYHNTPQLQQLINFIDVNNLTQDSSGRSFASLTSYDNGTKDDKGGVTAQFYLDKNALKEKELAWIEDAEKSKSRGVLLDGNCFSVTESGTFNIRVALTFQYGLNTPDKDMGTTFFTVIKYIDLNRESGQILEKKTIIPEKDREQMIDKTASPVVELKPEESVCVWVGKPQLLFQSKVDNVMSIFKVADAA